MKRRTQALWALGYLGATLVPLAVILPGPVTPRRGFWIEMVAAAALFAM